MIGIKAYGAYIPIYRLSHGDIVAVWGGASREGEKAIANHDEDSITMAVAACQDCLSLSDANNIDALYLASTTLSYKDKQSAAFIAEILDIPDQAVTIDFSNSLRASTSAITNALAATKSELANNVLVACSDGKLAAPKSDYEQLMGAGAAAFIIGNSDVLAEIIATETHHDEFLDMWRQSGDQFIKSGEDRFIVSEGYVRNAKEAARRTMDSLGLSAKDINKLVLYAPDRRTHIGLARQLGFNPETQLQDALINKVGNVGSASVPLMLVGALESSKPEDTIMVISYGDGCDTLVLKVNKNIEQFKPRRGLRGHLISKMQLRSYLNYLTFHNILPVEPMRRSPPISSIPAKWRAKKSLLSLHGSKCRNCNTVQFPVQRVCHICHSKDDFEEVPLSNLKGKIFTFTKDNMAPSAELPTIMTVLELENGCRFFCQMTDRDPLAVQTGMDVELTFRRVYDYGGYTNYYWKCRPIR